MGRSRVSERMSETCPYGCDPHVLDPETDRLFVRSLRHSQCKVLLCAANGDHIEIMLTSENEPGPIGTRCYMNLEATEPKLRDRLRPGDAGAEVIDRVNAYVSPPGCGSPLHFDIRTVWIVQLFGRKTWRTAAEPAVEKPSRNCVMPAGERRMHYDGIELEAPSALRERVLAPGDWLCIPRGVWHETTTTEGSVSATLAAPEGM